MLRSLHARYTVSALVSAFTASTAEDSHAGGSGPSKIALPGVGESFSAANRREILRLAAVVGVSCGVGLVLRWSYSLTFPVAYLLFRRIRVQRAKARRLGDLERDLPTLLTSVASSVRAGIDPLVAVAAARDFFPADSGMQRELSRFAQALAAGGDEFEVIDAFMQDVTSPEADLFKRCLSMSRRHGASLAEPLHRITKVIRQRHSFRRKTRASLAMHRLSAFGIALCAAVIGLVQFVTNATAVKLALNDSVGRVLLSVGVVLITTGVVWMTRMGREERL